ncbi:MAG: tetratricopeptide repeat protein [Chloroflexi bacterium]|nr:tetratricopeptide repeat protein [Chloroflexota bacterium]
MSKHDEIMYLRGSKWSMARRPKRRTNPWRIILLLILIGIALYFNQVVVPATPPLFIPTPTATRSPESFINEAEQYYAQGKLAQAVESYKSAIASDPNNPANFVSLARIHVFSGEYEDAITNAQNALLKNPDNPLAHAVYGWALSFTGDYLAGEAEIKKALELDSNSALAHAYYAELLINQGNMEDLEKAIEESRLARDLDPNLLEVHRARGLVLLNTGEENLPEAINEFKAAIAINDKIADIHLSLGYAYKLQGENDLAVEELLTAYALNPNDSTALTEAALAYANEGQYGKAAQHAEQAVSVDPSNPKLHGNLGVMYYRNQEFAKAVPELELAVRGGTTADGVAVQGMPLDYGSSAQFYWFLGFALAKNNRCGEAIPVFQALLTGVPDYQLAVDNANAGLELCMESIGTPEAGEATQNSQPPVATEEVTPTP